MVTVRKAADGGPNGSEVGSGTVTVAPRAVSTAELPLVTVIVPTYNRAYSLVDTLRGLVEQEYPADRLEVVVVDDGSTDDTERVVEEARRQSPFAVRYCKKPNGGIPAARNFGIARASGAIIGFTDSDCHVPPTWVRNAVRRMTPGVGLVTGPIRPIVHEQRRPGFFQHQLPEVKEEDPLYPGANMFYRREVLEQLGGFDERIGRRQGGPPVEGDDTLLAWRTRRAGYRTAFADDAPIAHEASALSPRRWLLAPLGVAIYPRLVRRVPELRQHHLFWRYFLGWGDLVFLLALAGAILGLTRSRRLLVLTAPWFWMLRGNVAADRWPPTRWWRIPIKYALLAERFGLVFGTLLVASVKHRSLVL